MNSTMMMLLLGLGGYLYFKNSGTSTIAQSGSGAAASSNVTNYVAPQTPVSSSNPISQTTPAVSNPVTQSAPTESSYAPQTYTPPPSTPAPVSLPPVTVQPGIVPVQPAPVSAISLNPTGSAPAAPPIYAPGPVINVPMGLYGLGDWRV